MKYKDITYVLNDKAIVPYKMGTVAVHLYDNNKSCKKYAFSSPEVNVAVELCKKHSLEDEVEDIIADITVPEGFYKKYIRYFIVYVKEDLDIACYPRIKYGHCRYWINGKLAFIGSCEDANPIYIYKYNLKKGKNIFCIELCSIGVPFIKIDIANRDTKSTCALADNNFWFTPGEFIVNCKSQFIMDTGIFEFNLLPLDLTLVDYESEVLLNIENFENGNILYEKEVNFKDVFALDLSFIPNMAEDEFNHLTAVFKAIGKDGCVYKKRVSIYRYLPKSAYQTELLQKAEEMLKKQLPEPIRNKANCLLHILKLGYGEPHYGECLKHLVESVDNGISYDFTSYSDEHYVYYYSKEDRKCYYYYIFLPDNYDPNKKYPLLLTISHGHVAHDAEYQNSKNYSHHFSRHNSKAIYADIGGRGCTTGSYMGETFILNEIKHILSHFSVDRNRIYGVGHCGGNISLLNIAQTHPHLFAGIYVRSCTPYMKNVKNLYNISCYYYISSYTKDANLFKTRKKLKRKLPKFNIIDAHDVYWDDLDMLRSQYTTAAIDKLMSEKREEYPNEIYFRTEFNRSNRAYYIEIESIQKGKSFADFSSKIIEGNIYIHTRNCTGLSIDIPPQINKQAFLLEINGKQFSFIEYDKDRIILHHTKKHGFVLTQETDSNVCRYKGTGILDVYFDPICVINCDPLNRAVAETANAFAHPTSNASYTYIYVDYPIKNLTDLPDEKKNALIIIDNNCPSSPELQFLRTKLPIQMDSDGYVYNGEKRTGKYCIMQVISNPWQANTSVLYVNTNCAGLFSQCLFTRKVVISSYISGMHPYLNSVALIFDGYAYYIIKEWGDSLTAVK